MKAAKTERLEEIAISFRKGVHSIPKFANTSAVGKQDLCQIIPPIYTYEYCTEKMKIAREWSKREARQDWCTWEIGQHLWR
jgi:hypothetical protein